MGSLLSTVMSKLDLARRAAGEAARESAWVPTDTRAQSGASQEAVNVVVGLLVGALMAAYLLPMAIDEIMAVDTGSWTGGSGALWDLLPVMIVLAIFLFFVNMAVERSERA